MKLVRLSVGILSLLVLASCGNKQGETKETPAVECEVMTVATSESATLESKFPANLRGTNDAEIRPRVDGIITEIYVDEGALVRKGQALFKIDNPQAVAAANTAAAAVKSAKAQMETARLGVESTKPLAEKGIVSEIQLKNAENAFLTAQAAVAQAQATLQNAQAALSWTTVTSPIDGVVGIINLRKGNMASPSTPLTTVASTSNVYAYFSINEKQLAGLLSDLDGKTQTEKIKNIPEVILTMKDGSVYSEKGRLETISGIIDQRTGSANFRAEFPNKDGLLRSGASGTVTIPRHLENVIVIPQEATFSLQDKNLVYKVHGDSISQSVVSVTSLPDGKSYIVTEGLTVGEEIVKSGLASLRNGMKIKPKK